METSFARSTWAHITTMSTYYHKRGWTAILIGTILAAVYMTAVLSMADVAVPTSKPYGATVTTIDLTTADKAWSIVAVLAFLGLMVYEFAVIHLTATRDMAGETKPQVGTLFTAFLITLIPSVVIGVIALLLVSLFSGAGAIIALLLAVAVEVTVGLWCTATAYGTVIVRQRDKARSLGNAIGETAKAVMDRTWTTTWPALLIALCCTIVASLIISIPAGVAGGVTAMFALPTVAVVPIAIVVGFLVAIVTWVSIHMTMIPATLIVDTRVPHVEPGSASIEHTEEDTAPSSFVINETPNQE